MKKGRSKKRRVEGNRETVKEEDTSPSSTSHIETSTSTSAFVAASDETTISSSTRACDETASSPSSPLPTVKQKATVDSPPDDLRAFFGHPLTRATTALNGEEFDTNANAEALLHEYINLQAIEREDLKVNEKFSGLLNIISAQRSDPTLSRTGSETLSSPPAADSHPTSAGINQDGVGIYDEELVGEPSQQGDAIVIPEYPGVFPPEFQLDLIEGHMEGRADSSRIVGSTRSVVRRCAERHPRKIKQRKEDRGPLPHKRGQACENKRATRKARTKSDVVTSTTNSPMKPDDSRAVTNDLPENVSGNFLETNIISGSGHHYQREETTVKPQAIPNSLNSVITPPLTVACSIELSQEKKRITSSTCPGSENLIPSRVTVTLEEVTDNQLTLPVSQVHHVNQVQTSTGADLNSVISASLASHLTTSLTSSVMSSVTAVTVSSPATTTSTPAVLKDTSHNASLNSQVKENFLKKALSEKIRSRLFTEDILSSISDHNAHFLTDDAQGVELDTKFSPMAGIKQEDPYMESYDHQYSYTSNFSNASLANFSSLDMSSFAPPNVVSVTMATCDDIMAVNDTNNNGLSDMAHASLSHIHDEPVDPSHIHETVQYHHHHHHQHHDSHQQQQDLVSDINNSQVEEDSMIVQSSHGRYFQVLQPLQPMESHAHVTSTIPSTSIVNSGYYNSLYQGAANTQLLETDKQEKYIYQPRHCGYGNGYNPFVSHDTTCNIKSPDSGFQEPCLSPGYPTVTMKDVGGNGTTEAAKEKIKKKKTSADGESGCGVTTKQFSSSGSDKSVSRSPVIKKLETNTTGYGYFLEAPISTTQRKDEDRVTYLNKSQYYSLTLEFNTQERVHKCSVAKSVIILTFREEKAMDEEKRAWEFWHGRQHSYKQRILDIDTKNCYGVTPQNIEEVAFNAVAIKWNPMDGPARVNMAVHCLSTDFSNQKGVKGIPLHIQIDTYEQSPRGSQLVHRGFCQIKAFCDKGAERKTRDEERRKATKGKTEEFSSVPSNIKTGRRKTEEAFHDPCERSEFYSMADMTTAPIFFNPLHESTEFIHRSLSIGVLPSQDEEISSLPSGLELPDSCDDYYTNNPAKRPRRDSCSNPKDQLKVLLYVRERHETVYTALMLEVPTLQGLLKSIEQKYSIAPFKVKNLYKKSRKGILVKLDDNIVRHYSHEATFIIETNMLNDSGEYEIIFIEIDAVSS